MAGALTSSLILLAIELEKLGELELAKRKAREVLADSEAFDGSPVSFYFIVTGRLAYSEANLDGVQEAVRDAAERSRLIANAPSRTLSVWREWFARAGPPEGSAGDSEKEKTMWENLGVPTVASYLAWQLCTLACEAGHPREGLACLAQHSPSPRVTVGANVKGAISVQIARCRYLADDMGGAESAAVAAQKEAELSELYEQRILSNVYLMRARAGRGETSKAIARLRIDLAETERRKTKALSFEVALALGDVELRSGRREGRARLLALEQEAKSKEFFRIARLAREALDQHPARPGSRPPR